MPVLLALLGILAQSPPGGKPNANVGLNPFAKIASRKSHSLTRLARDQGPDWLSNPP